MNMDLTVPFHNHLEAVTEFSLGDDGRSCLVDFVFEEVCQLLQVSASLFHFPKKRNFL